MTALVVASLAVLSVSRVLSLRWSRGSVGQLLATVALAPVGVAFVALVLPAEQRLLHDTALSAPHTVAFDLLLLAGGHLALAGALVLAGILVATDPARRRLAPLPRPPKRD